MAGSSTGYRAHVDAKRRPTLPAAVLAAACISDSRELVVRADGVGRLVLKDPAIMLAEFQAAVARGTAAAGFQGSDTPCRAAAGDRPRPHASSKASPNVMSQNT